MILRIAVPVPLYTLFDYLPPPNTTPDMFIPGVRVSIPFGPRTTVGILIETITESTYPATALRKATAILDTKPIFSADVWALLQWAQNYYCHPPGEVFAAALPKWLRQGQPAVPFQKKAARPIAHPAQKAVPPTLTDAQKNVIVAVEATWGSFQVFLLEGVTGSGKTEVYLRLIQTVLKKGQQALVLVPEIGLTPQMLARFQARLSVQMVVLHSGLKDKIRHDNWLAAREGSARVIIGTRSAVFTPLKALGLIIVDEEHDPSLKQQEKFRYHGRDLAIVRAQKCQIPIVLGTATPALETAYQARRGQYQWLQLPDRVGGGTNPLVQLLDMRCCPAQNGLSLALIEKMQEHLGRGEQVLLFLNQRGFAPALWCNACGWTSRCSHCDARMTLHVRPRRLICHHCGTESVPDTHCPKCQQAPLLAVGQGTERIELALRKTFPEVGIARLDTDTTVRRGHWETVIEQVRSGACGIIIGTQMLAKGHHFPNITLVGIVDIDRGLHSTDFRATERMAQLIVQVAGRAGREEKPGLVILQTHFPEHPQLRLLLTEGFQAFTETLLGEREAALLPPFTSLALLRAEAANADDAMDFLQKARDMVESVPETMMLLGPAPAPMQKRAGQHRAHLLVQADTRAALRRFLAPWVNALWAAGRNSAVRWSVDVDPLDLF